MRKPAPATVIALIALFVSLGGTAYAATNLPANSVGSKQLKSGAVTTRSLRTHAVTGSKVADKSLTGTQIDSSTLGTVPNATHATNADQLAGQAASTYIAHCPSGLHRTPNGDLCFDFTERPAATWMDALKTCASAGLRLPDLGELVQAFNDLGALQDAQWTSTEYFLRAVPDSASGNVALLAYQDTNRQIIVPAYYITTSYPYRCVTSATN
jgi:hypothetical protein